jgi:LacI family transcriptional regulator
MSITIKDIAKIAGVSYSTVSRSLNDSPLVAEETKNKVKQIAEDLGFQFNANARSLTTNRTGTIGIIYPENFEDFGINLYYSSLHNQLRKSLEEKDLDLIVTFPKNRVTKENNIKKLITRKKVDGFIIAYSNLNYETIYFIENSKIPYVFFHHPIDFKLEDVDLICTNHFEGGYLATQHLINCGRRRIMCISAGEEQEFRMRTDGYKAALLDNSIPYSDSLILQGEPIFHSMEQLINKNINIIKSIDAIFAHTDLMAWGIMEALKKHNIRIPEDIAVIGYDDIELSSYITPKLTTIHQPRENIAILTCERLYELLNSKSIKRKKKMLLKPSLVIRESCGYDR